MEPHASWLQVNSSAEQPTGWGSVCYSPSGDRRHLLIFRFGLFELDPSAAELSREGRRIPLQEQPLTVLGALLENPGRVVEREELRQRLWPIDVHVDVDNGINTAVARLREALGDSAGNPRFVATVPRRGYRFIAPVQTLDDPAAPEGKLDPSRPQHASTLLTPSWIVPVLAALSIAVAIGTGLVSIGGRQGSTLDQQSQTDAPRQIRRLAVLPFTDLDTTPEVSALGIGLTEELITLLGQLQPVSLRLIARTSVMAHHTRGTTLEDIARYLNVDYILEGTVQKEAETVRVTAALVETSTQTRLWSASFDRQLESLISLERDIAAAVTTSLALELDMALETEPSAIAGRVESGPTAWVARETSGKSHQLLLEGRYFLAQRTEAGFRKALVALQAALGEDPESASAHAELAAAWAFLALFDHAPRNEAFARAEREIEQALAIDPGLAKAFLVGAVVEFFFRWDFAAAADSLDQALALNPSSAEAHLFAAGFYASLGQAGKTKVALLQALELDPLSPAAHSEAAWLFFVLGEEEQALAHIHRALELDPDFLEAWDVRKWIHIQRGEESAAIEAFLHVVVLERLHASEVESLRAVGEEQGLQGLLRASVANPELRLRETGQSPYNLALDHAALGEPEIALDYLETAFAQRETDLVNLASDPRLQSLQEHPRFRRLIEDIGLHRGQERSLAGPR